MHRLARERAGQPAAGRSGSSWLFLSNACKATSTRKRMGKPRTFTEPPFWPVSQWEAVESSGLRTCFGGRKTWVQILALPPPTCGLVAGHRPRFFSPGAVVKSQWGDSREALTKLLGSQSPSLVALLIGVLSITGLYASCVLGTLHQEEHRLVRKQTPAQWFEHSGNHSMCRLIDAPGFNILPIWPSVSPR